MKACVVFALALLWSLVLVCVGASTSIHIQRQKPRFERVAHSVSAHRQLTRHAYRAGSAINMTGGVLTLGAYFTEVTVGTPPQKFSLLVDTGSSNTVVPVESCKSCGGGPFYKPSLSTSYAEFPCSSSACHKCSVNGTGECAFGAPYCYASTKQCGFGISYGGGSSVLTGYHGYDRFCLGTYCTTATVGLGTAQYPNNSLPTGILGLASPFNACNPTCVTTVFDSLVEKNLTENLYGMCITPSNGGIIDVGKVAQRYTGTIEFVPMEVNRWFNIVLLDVVVGSTSLGLPPVAYATTNDVIGSFVDSGTSIVLFSPLAFGQIQSIFETEYAKLPFVTGDTSLFTGACYNASQITPFISKFPKIEFVVKQTAAKNLVLNVPASSYLMEVDGQICLGLQAVPGVGVVLGDLFLENYYTVHDRAHHQVGFAPLLPGSCSTK